jgi:hypothetical protein
LAPRWLALAGALLLSAGSLAACAGTAKNVKVTPTTAEQERVFDHGVDFVAALEGLEGRWREDWDRDLQERIGGADYIGVVHIDTLLTETNPEQRVTHGLNASVERSLYGEAKDLQLRVSEGQPGFATVHDNLQRVESRDFVVYVKWYRDADGDRAAHFHLSPASDVIVAETERGVGLRSTAGGDKPAAQERVIVHNN